jgi:hypothetical protein
MSYALMGTPEDSIRVCGNSFRDATRVAKSDPDMVLDFLLTTRGWYLGIEPLHVDFRYWVYSSTQSRTGFSQIVPLRVAIGHEF